MLGILGYPKQQSGLCVVKPGEANKVMTGGRERTEVSYRLDLDFIRSSFDAVQSERICLMIPRNLSVGVVCEFECSASGTLSSTGLAALRSSPASSCPNRSQGLHIE